MKSKESWIQELRKCNRSKSHGFMAVNPKMEFLFQIEYFDLICFQFNTISLSFGIFIVTLVKQILQI